MRGRLAVAAVAAAALLLASASPATGRWTFNREGPFTGTAWQSSWKTHEFSNSSGGPLTLCADFVIPYRVVLTYAPASDGLRLSAWNLSRNFGSVDGVDGHAE